jgi:predicted ATPase
MFLMEQRDIKLKRFAQANKKNTYGDIVNEFDQNNSKILKEIAFFWNKILDKSNLYFDYESAKNPIQFLDNLQAYIKNKHTHEVIPYNALSTGIRNFMFRLGHIYSLYFNKNIENGFLLVDEPENSLFPDFLYDLIDIYLEIIGNNTQFFVATHNPIIASQFEPYERVILRFDDEGFVQAHRGESPVGDDPNDLLENDFAVRNLMPRQGRDAFKTYQNLRRTLRETTNEAEKEDLMTAIATLGRLYNF